MDDPVDETICAIATPMGEGGISIIRVSGPGAVSVAGQVVRPRNRASLHALESHRLYVSDVVGPGSPPGHPQTPAVPGGPPQPSPRDGASAVPWSAGIQEGATGMPAPGSVLDEALVVVMRAPRSYTGEDVVEIQTHGGVLIVQTVCQGLVQHGARLAQPGEFTKRAFLNGRLDLAQAEAVLDTIHATTSRGLQAAQAILRGALSQELDVLRDHLLRVLAHLEAGMDFAEDEIECIRPQEAQRVLDDTRRALDRLIASYDEGRVVRDGITVAIVGRPNVGKSSLLNALLNVERAIVSDHPGTTRDVIDESLQVGGIALRLLDTAGLRPTTDPIEAEGMRRTEDAMADADVLLIVIDGAVGLTAADQALLDTAGGRRALLVVNKMDLPEARARPPILAFAEPAPGAPCDPGTEAGGGAGRVHPVIGDPGAVVPVSARTGEGLDRLKSAIHHGVVTPAREAAPSVLVTRLRHRASLERARGALDEALHALHRQVPGECVALDLRAALDALGEITGAVSTEDLLDRIFQEFCIGK